MRSLWGRVQARDWDGARGLLADGMVCRWPHSDERFEGADVFIAVGVGPAPSPGIGLRVGLGRGRLALELEARAVAPSRVPAASGHVAAWVATLSLAPCGRLGIFAACAFFSSGMAALLSSAAKPMAAGC